MRALHPFLMLGLPYRGITYCFKLSFSNFKNCTVLRVIIGLNSDTKDVCVDNKPQYSELRDNIHRPTSALRKKEADRKKLVSVAVSHAKCISYLRSSCLAGLAALLPSGLESQTVLASAAALAWLASMHAGTRLAVRELSTQ